jgi:hypothetical protein
MMGQFCEFLVEIFGAEICGSGVQLSAGENMGGCERPFSSGKSEK